MIETPTIALIKPDATLQQIEENNYSPALKIGDSLKYYPLGATTISTWRPAGVWLRSGYMYPHYAIRHVRFTVEVRYA